jgi:IS30 family transposase
MSYTQLTQEQRYQIYALLKMGHNQTAIATVICMHKATISRELGRNSGLRGYRPKQAHHKALRRRNHGRARILPKTWEMITAKLRLDWSPEQISGWLNRHHAIQVSHEWIYQHILADKHAGGNLYRHLRCQKKRRKRYGSYDRRGKLPNRVSIEDPERTSVRDEERPDIVAQRLRIGDWEPAGSAVSAEWIPCLAKDIARLSSP